MRDRTQGSEPRTVTERPTGHAGRGLTSRCLAAPTRFSSTASFWMRGVCAGACPNCWLHDASGLPTYFAGPRTWTTALGRRHVVRRPPSFTMWAGRHEQVVEWHVDADVWAYAVAAVWSADTERFIQCSARGWFTSFARGTGRRPPTIAFGSSGSLARGREAGMKSPDDSCFLIFTSANSWRAHALAVRQPNELTAPGCAPSARWQRGSGLILCSLLWPYWLRARSITLGEGVGDASTMHCTRLALFCQRCVRPMSHIH